MCPTGSGVQAIPTATQIAPGPAADARAPAALKLLVVPLRIRLRDRCSFRFEQSHAFIILKELSNIFLRTIKCRSCSCSDLDGQVKVVFCDRHSFSGGQS
jgi:hypothetical protein